MAQVALAYGPPARVGVTTLMSVGDVDKALTDRTAEYVEKGTYVVSAVYILGWIAGSQKTKTAALGAAVALYIIQTLAGKEA